MDNYKSVIEPYLQNRATGCSFCDKLEPLIILEANYLYITVAIGQIIEGYLQICTKKHKTSLGSLSENEINEFKYLRGIIKISFLEAYNTTGILFENGRSSINKWSPDRVEEKSLDYHAHVHFVPCNVDIRKRIKSYIEEEITIADYGEIGEIKNTHLDGGRYLYFEDVDENGFLYPVRETIIPSQLIRSCIARELGLPERANWKQTPGYELFDTTKNKLEPIITRLVDCLDNTGN